MNIKKTILLFLFILLIIPSGKCVYARSAEPSVNYSTEETFVFSDGSSLTVTLNQWISRTDHTVRGTKTYTRKNSSGTVLWDATLDAVFTYNGTSSSCTGGSCSFNFYNSSYSLVSSNVSTSGNTASATFTVARKILGITISTETHTITLSCDKYGNLS